MSSFTNISSHFPGVQEKYFHPTTGKHCVRKMLRFDGKKLVLKVLDRAVLKTDLFKHNDKVYRVVNRGIEELDNVKFCKKKDKKKFKKIKAEFNKYNSLKDKAVADAKKADKKAKIRAEKDAKKAAKKAEDTLKKTKDAEAQTSDVKEKAEQKAKEKEKIGAAADNDPEVVQDEISSSDDDSDDDDKIGGSRDSDSDDSDDEKGVDMKKEMRDQSTQTEPQPEDKPDAAKEKEKEDGPTLGGGCGGGVGGDPVVPQPTRSTSTRYGLRDAIPVVNRHAEGAGFAPETVEEMEHLHDALQHGRDETIEQIKKKAADKDDNKKA